MHCSNAFGPPSPQVETPSLKVYCAGWSYCGSTQSGGHCEDIDTCASCWASKRDARVTKAKQDEYQITCFMSECPCYCHEKEYLRWGVREASGLMVFDENPTRAWSAFAVHGIPFLVLSSHQNTER